jgi:hypothetical protein
MKITALFETTLAASISATATSATLTYGKDKLGNDLSGEYGFIIDEGTNKEEFIIADVSGTALTDMQRGISPSDGRTEVSALKFAHRKGASVKITDFPILGLLTDYLTGVIPLPAVPKLDPSRVISDPNHIIDKAYGDAIGVAGITGFLVQNGTGKQININAGTYIKNGEILTYAGASGVAVSTGNNYVEFKDGAISINQTGFTNDSYSLALVVCNASTITSNTDKRSFINITDLRANTNGTLLTGAVIAGMRVHTGWTGITNGSFRATIDGVAWNFDAINFSTAASMTDVATLIQTKIRAITGATETVSYDAATYKFTITSSTTGTESQVSVLSTSTGTVGTDISGANYLNGASGTATQGTGNFIDRDSLGLFAKIGQGLKIIDGYLLVKLKNLGGVLNGADGLYVDDTIFAKIANVLGITTTSANDYLAGETIGIGKTFYKNLSADNNVDVVSADCGTGTGYDLQLSTSEWYAMRIDNTTSPIKILGLDLTVSATSFSAGNLLVELRRGDITNIAGSTVVASKTHAIGTSGAKVLNFDTPYIADLSLNNYFFTLCPISGVFKVLTRYSDPTGHGYLYYKSTNSGGSWAEQGAGYYQGTYNVNCTTLGQNYCYLGTTTAWDGICQANTAKNTTFTGITTGVSPLSGATLGAMNYSNGSGGITPTRDGTKVSVGIGIETNKILIVKGMV